MAHALAVSTVAVAILILILNIDDLFIDFVAFWARLRPRDLTENDLEQMQGKLQKRIAIVIANWHEDLILAAMIRGNLRQIEYENYMFFLGVYPNDEATLRVAQQLEREYPHRVRAVVNRRLGPTSKGQMLNEIARHLLTEAADFDLLLMQDSEDVLHRHSLTVLNAWADHVDFIQLPVFSFDVPKRSLVAGVYVDEFSEPHTKDLLVRDHLGAAIPSAGVGTLVSRRLAQAIWDRESAFLREDTLTEDYHLGMSVKSYGFKSRFLCTRWLKTNGTKEFIATREYFPAQVNASIRQKSRWTLGIVYQGRKNLGWQGEWIDRYFVARDRKGPLCSLLALTSIFLLVLLSALHNRLELTEFRLPWLQILLGANLTLMLWRLAQRMRAVFRTHSALQASLVPVRWLVGTGINFMAFLRARRQFYESERIGNSPAWAKTTHRLPEGFGEDSLLEGVP